MDALWRLVDHLLSIASRNKTIVICSVGIGLVRTVHSWLLGTGYSLDVPTNARLMIDAGEIVVFGMLSLIVKRYGPLCRNSLPPLAGISGLVIAFAAASPITSSWAEMTGKTIGYICAGMSYAVLILVWLEFCGCMAPISMTISLAASYAVSSVGWIILRPLTGAVGYVTVVFLYLASTLFLVQAYRSIPPKVFPRIVRPQANASKVISIFPMIWTALMGFIYGFGDCFTRLGFSTLPAKLGMAIPLIIIVISLILTRNKVDIRIVYRMSLVLMGAGATSIALFDGLSSVSQVLMSAAHAGNMIIICVMACTSAHRRHESAIIGCGVLLGISLISALIGNVAGMTYIGIFSCFSESMTRIVGALIALAILPLAIYPMRDEDLSTLIAIRFKSADINLYKNNDLGKLQKRKSRPLTSTKLYQACIQLSDSLKKSDEEQSATYLLEVAKIAGLSNRETAVFSLMVNGDNIASISEQLFIAQGTVRAHMSHIYEKIGVHSREEFDSLLDGK